MSSQYKSSTSLQVPQASVAKSAAFATTAAAAAASSSSSGGGGTGATTYSGLSHPNERRYWTTKFGFGSKSTTKSSKKTAPSIITFATSSASAPISGLTFSYRSNTNHQLAVVAGPRVSLYGPGGNCALGRALAGDGGRGGGEPNLFGDNATDVDDTSGGPNLVEIRPDRTIGTGGHPACCASYRRDGRLIAVGTDGGDVRVCDTTSRATLRTFRPAEGDGGGRQRYPVRSVAWLHGDGKRLVSGGDDAVVRVWDLSGGGGGGGGGADAGVGGIGGSAGDSGAGPILSMAGHGDSVRCVVSLRVRVEGGGETRHLAVSGSYDHTVRVWDVGTTTTTTNSQQEQGDRCTSVLNHGSPVERVLILPPTETQPSPLIVSAGGTVLKLWNPITGVCLVTVRTMHSKTITSLVLMDIVRNDDNTTSETTETEQTGTGRGRIITNRRLLTGGLDGLIRIHSADGNPATAGLPYLHGIKTPHPITSLASSPDGVRIVVGTSNGLVTVRQRAKLVPQGIPLNKKRKADSRAGGRTQAAGTYSYFMRGADVTADADDHVVILDRKKRLRSYDVMLRQFRYGDALDEALACRQPDVIMAVLEELGKRRGLTQSLSNRDEETLEPILAFTARYIARPRYTPVLIGVADRLCDVYGTVFGQSEIIDEHFAKLRRHVRDEARVQRNLLKLVGQIDSVMFAAEMASTAEEEEH